MRKGKRYNIGLLVSGIADSFTEQICNGVLRRAADEDANVFILPGKYIYRDTEGQPELMYEYQNSAVFSSIRKDNIDGLIICASCIGCLTTEEKLMSFLKGFEEIPHVLAASHYEGHNCIYYDNSSGVIEGMKYLIERLGCRNICMIDGTEGNSDAYERRQAFINTMNKYELPLSEKNFARGNLANTEETGKAMEQLLTDNPEMEAVFCVNDDTAMAAYEVIRSHGLVPGKDILVMGYDNVYTSANMDPPLSTVVADPVALGAASLDAIIKVIEGIISNDVILPARFILRESFGRINKLSRGTSDAETDFLREDFDTIFYHYINAFGVEAAETTYEKFRRFMLGLYDPSGKLTASKAVMELLEDFIGTNAINYMDTDEFLLLIDRGIDRAITGKKIPSGDETELFGLRTKIYRRLVRAIDKRLTSVVWEQYQLDFSMKVFVRETLNFRHGADQSYQVLLNYLDWLEVKNACLYMFKEPLIRLSADSFESPEELEMMAVRVDGVVSIPPLASRHKTIREIFDLEMFGDRRYSMLVMPLFFEEEIYGFIFCDMTERLYREGEFMANQLGVASRMLHILKVSESAQQQLEEHLSVMRQHNIELDTISRIDPLTGLLNRRGFMMAAKEWSSKTYPQGILVGYADMNNLKIVNDRFGHDDGDFALKTIAGILTEALPEGSVIARIGGDEYAFLTAGSAEDEQGCLKKIGGMFSSFNRSSDKPYNVSISVGMCHVPEEREWNLEEALVLADEKLYVAKQSKDRKIVK